MVLNFCKLVLPFLKFLCIILIIEVIFCMDTSGEVTFLSFLASVLLVKSDIGYSEICSLISEFENKYEIDVVDPSDDLEDFDRCVYYDQDGVHLLIGYDDFLINRTVTVRDYLLSLSNDFVNEYLVNKFDVVIKERTIA